MIYLIDDKTNRQQDFGWDENKLLPYKDIIVSISCFSEMESREQRELMFSDGNIILYHESFFENIDYKHKKDGNEIKNDLSKFPLKKKNSKIVFFSGSYNSREVSETGGSIPVSILYQNLDCFLNDYKKKGLINLNYLFFGENPEIESKLINKNETSNSLLIDELTHGKINCLDNTVIITGNRLGFPNPFNDLDTLTIFNKNINDHDISLKINEWFSEKDYTKIFIPLCFGPTLSDYNGLRLATHIRCADSKNQLKPIFIYSFVDLSFLIKNEYFDILKTKNIFLIGCSKQNFHEALDLNISDLTIDLLPKEIKKLNLQIPTNYEDNHSIANEWAIYRWSKIIGASDENIEKINDLQNSNLYFKYLKTIYPIGNFNKLNDNQLVINSKGNLKVLYIDDEAEKGWREVFETIFYDKNENIDFSYLDKELNDRTRKEICELALLNIKKENIDVVILDFRLHKDDFGDANIYEITGYQILKKIKAYNKGIQVIIFSATNKIWNLQALQDAGADGFIIKESPENSVDSEFTKKSIESFRSTTEECLSRSFLKYFFKNCDKIEQNISRTYSDPQSPFDDFKKELMVSLKIISDSANNIDLSVSSSLDVVFLNCYNFLEKFKHFYVKEIKFKHVLGFEEVEMNRYYFRNSLISQGVFIRINIADNPSFFHSIIALLIDYFEIINADNINIEKIYQIKESRNNYIHNDKSNFNINELSDIINVCKIITDNLKD